jgi:hypothetical protein
MTMKGGISDDFLVTISSSQAIPQSRCVHHLDLHESFCLGLLFLIQLSGESQACPSTLLTFTFRQGDARLIECQALPGPETRALRAKTIRHTSFLGPGGQAVLFQDPADSDVGAAGWGPDGPPHSAEARQDLRAEFFSRRSFLRATPLFPGHKLALEQKWDRNSEDGED